MKTDLCVVADQVCLGWKCGGFFVKNTIFLSINHTFKNYKNMLFTQKKHKLPPIQTPSLSGLTCVLRS